MGIHFLTTLQFFSSLAKASSLSPCMRWYFLKRSRCVEKVLKICKEMMVMTSYTVAAKTAKAARIKQRRSGAQACCVTAQTPANPEVRAGRESSRVRKCSVDFEGWWLESHPCLPKHIQQELLRRLLFLPRSNAYFNTTPNRFELPTPQHL